MSSSGVLSAEEKGMRLEPQAKALEPLHENSVIASFASWLISDKRVDDPEAIEIKTMSLGRYMSNLYGISLVEVNDAIDQAVINAVSEQRDTHADPT